MPIINTIITIGGVNAVSSLRLLQFTMDNGKVPPYCNIVVLIFHEFAVTFCGRCRV